MAMPYTLLQHLNGILDDMQSLSETPGLTTHDIDCQMARMRVFQETVRALFSGLYPDETEEDTQVRVILLEWATASEDLVMSDAQPDVYQRQPSSAIPLVCLPFLLANPMPSREEAPHLHEVHLRGSLFLREFLELTDDLAEHGVEATFNRVPLEARRAFVASARAFAQAMVQYPQKKRGTAGQHMVMLLDELPFAEMHSWSGEAAAIRHRQRLGALFYGMFGEALTDLRLAQIICRYAYG